LKLNTSKRLVTYIPVSGTHAKQPEKIKTDFDPKSTKKGGANAQGI
jgi:hypothetical protein